MARIVLLAALVAVPSVVTAQDRVTGRPFATRSEVVAKHGMAATSHPIATQVALDVLKAGGNAIDAAIAANALLGLVEPTGNGIGGDLFAVVWDAEAGRLVGLNGSGRSPASLTLEELTGRGLEKIPALGPLPVSVPGCVDGWFALHGRFGRLPMAEVLAPAIRYAREGAAITETIAYYWAIGAARLGAYPGWSKVFAPDGRAPRNGELFRNPALAKTLEALAEDGRDVFYRGRIAREIAAFMAEHGGFLAYDDLAAHESEWVTPLSANYRGYDVWELPPNGQGIAALQILNLLEAWDVRALGFGSPEYVHRFVEAKKLAFEDRARWYADPAFAELPIARLISKEYADERRELIDPERAGSSYPAGALESGDTIYLTTADEAGNMVSLIQSNYRGFGSGMTPASLGFCLQDRGELFDLRPGRPNLYAPKKRPFHTIIPAFITKDGKPWVSFGVMGGAMQPQGHAQIVVNLIDFGMNLQEAGDAPRIRHSGSSQPTGDTMTDGGTVHLETWFPASVVRRLGAMGHCVVQRRDDGGFGGYQAIRWDAENGVFVGASESRKDGHAAGY